MTSPSSYLHPAQQAPRPGIISMPPVPGQCAPTDGRQGNTSCCIHIHVRKGTRLSPSLLFIIIVWGESLGTRLALWCCNW